MFTKTIATIMGLINAVVGFVRYVKARLNERSTWVAMGTGVASASALKFPWNTVFAVMSAIGVLIPDGAVKKKP